MCQRFVKSFTEKVIKELEKESTYILLDCDEDWGYSAGYEPRILLEFTSSKDKFIENFARTFSFNIYPFGALIYDILTHYPELFSDECIKILNEEDVEDYDFDEKYLNNNEKFIMKEFEDKRLEIFQKIDQKIGLMNYFNKLPIGCGTVVLLEDNTGIFERLKENGCSW